MANTYILVGTSSSGTRTKWTTSFWIKRNGLSSDSAIFGAYLDGSNYDLIKLGSNGALEWQSYQAGSFANGGKLKTNRLFRDTSAWYHIVCRWDTNNSTANDRMKIWVNGEEETSFAERTNPTSGRESLINYQQVTAIGRLASNYLDGCMSHIHFCDNQLYQASDFGETDSTTGEWKIKTDVSVSYGTTGYFILKDGNSLTDQSGLGNDFSLQGGTLTKTEDCPSNVFATMNPLVKSNNSLTNGNLTVTQNSGTNYQNSISTLAVTKGKWYVECKLSTISGLYPGVGIIDVSENGASDGDDNGYFGSSDNPKGVQLFTGGFYSTGNGTNASLTSNSVNDIIGIALDLDSATKNIKMYKNGTLITGSSVTPPDPDGGYAFGVTMHSSGSGAVAQWNFGNGYFGTTAVASAGTNASGNGIFEYDVPTGYTALSTKGLNL